MIASCSLTTKILQFQRVVVGSSLFPSTQFGIGLRATKVCLHVPTVGSGVLLLNRGNSLGGRPC